MKNYLLFLIFTLGLGFSFRLRANDPIQMTKTAIQPPQCSLPGPTNLRSTAIGSTWISLKWDAVPGASAYRVRAVKLPAGPPVPSFNVSTPEATISNLSPGRYKIFVAAICSSGIVSEDEAPLTKSTIILDIVLNAQPPQGCNFIGAGTTHSEPWSGASCWVKTTHAEGEAYFQIKTLGSWGVSMGKVNGWCDPIDGQPIPLPNELDAELTDQNGNESPNPNTITFVKIMHGSTLICKVFASDGGAEFHGSLQDINVGGGYVAHFLNELSFAPPSSDDRENQLARSETLQISLLENPVGGAIRCSVSPPIGEAFGLSLLNMEGQILYEQRFGAGEQIEINAEYLPAGLYFLRAQSAGQQRVLKVVKSR